MIDIRRILCPTDFSEHSRRAFDHAVAMAKWYGSTVTLLHVCTPEPVGVYAPGTPMLRSAALTHQDRDALRAAMTRFADTGAGSTVPVEFEVVEGTAATQIVARVDATNSDLLVMGTHGRSGFQRFLLGSVTEKVLRQATCPMLSVPPHLADAVPAPPLFKRILCAVDFSDCSIRALNYAMSLAQEIDARLTVVHVIDMAAEAAPDDVYDTALGGPRRLSDYLAAAEEERRECLRNAVPDAVRAYCTVETVLARGKPYREILRIAAEQQSELIAIGIHGRGAPDLLFLGSTANHLVRQASCPVLTLRSRLPGKADHQVSSV